MIALGNTSYNSYNSYRKAKEQGLYIFKDKYHFDNDDVSKYHMSKVSSGIRIAYGSSSRRLEKSAASYFSSIKDFNEIIKMQESVLNKQFSQESFFNGINQLVEKELLNLKIDNTPVRKLNTFQADDNTWRRVTQIASDIDKIISKFQSINVDIYNYLKSHKETEHMVPPKMGQFFFLDKKEFRKAKAQYDGIVRAKANIESLAGNIRAGSEIQSILRRMAGSISGDLKGSIKEFSSYVLQKTAYDEVLNDFAKKTGRNLNVKVELSGGDMNFIIKGDQVSKKHTSKSDTVSYFYEQSPEKKQILIGMTGVSTKSHSSRAAANKHNIATGNSWTDVFHYADLLNTPFEFLYLNSMIHTPKNLVDKKLNRYLAAKASAFLVSGAMGGTSPESMFMEYSNKVWYVPDLLKSIEQSRTKGLFNIVPHGMPSNINQFVTTTNSKATNALIRKNIAIRTARAKIKFNATGARTI